MNATENVCVLEMPARHIGDESVNSITQIMADRSWTTSTGKSWTITGRTASSTAGHTRGSTLGAA